MEVICFDLEGVFVPEIWINVANTTGIEALQLTTRDICDYDKLMQYRLKILDEHQIRIQDIQQVIAQMEPLTGASEFLDWVRMNFQAVVLSDTFYEFAAPLMAQLNYPVLFCHNLEIASDGRITDYHIRLPQQKKAAVQAFQELNFEVFAVGDSYNDTAMLLAADHGFLFNPPATVADEFSQLPVVTNYEELKLELMRVSSRSFE